MIHDTATMSAEEIHEKILQLGDITGGKFCSTELRSGYSPSEKAEFEVVLRKWKAENPGYNSGNGHRPRQLVPPKRPSPKLYRAKMNLSLEHSLTHSNSFEVKMNGLCTKVGGSNDIADFAHFETAVLTRGGQIYGDRFFYHDLVTKKREPIWRVIFSGPDDHEAEWRQRWVAASVLGFLQ